MNPTTSQAPTLEMVILHKANGVVTRLVWIHHISGLLEIGSFFLHKANGVVTRSGRPSGDVDGMQCMMGRKVFKQRVAGKSGGND